MWNLFSPIQPKVSKPSKSLKQQMLLQQSNSLQQIQKEAQRLLISINNLLKNPILSQINKQSSSEISKQSSPQINKQSQSQIQQKTTSQIELHLSQIQNNAVILNNKIVKDNQYFVNALDQRDNQKTYQQQFFKDCMKNYQSKKMELNTYIQQLQNKVQKLQEQGAKTYQSSPKPSNVLTGINKSYIQKYLMKLDQQEKIKQILKKSYQKKSSQHRSIKSQTSQQNMIQNQISQDKLLKNQTSQNIIKNKQFQINNQNNKSNQDVQNKLEFQIFSEEVDFATKCNSLNDLQKQLEILLLKEQTIQTILDQKILKTKTKFDLLAAKQKIFRNATNKVVQANQQRRKAKKSLARISNSTNSLSLTGGKISLTTPKISQTGGKISLTGGRISKIAKSSSITQEFQVKQLKINQTNEQNNNQSSICPSVKQIQNSFQQAIEQNSQPINIQNDIEIVSQNFIEACEYLLSQHYIKDLIQEQQMAQNQHKKKTDHNCMLNKI